MICQCMSHYDMIYQCMSHYAKIIISMHVTLQHGTNAYHTLWQDNQCVHVTLWHDACHSIWQDYQCTSHYAKIYQCMPHYAKIYQCMLHYDMVPMHIILWQDNQYMHFTIWHDVCHCIWQDYQCTS